MAAGQYPCLYVLGSMFLSLAVIACGISFFGPYWLYNVTNPIPMRANVESDINQYIVYPNATMFTYRGLWAQCADICQWFWESNYQLQLVKFNHKLGWHLATQVLYFIGAFLVLFCEIFARLQMCCRPRSSVYRSLGFILLSSFVIQAAAVAVFGGFANRDYGATAYATAYTYLGWCFWMTLAGGGMTLTAGILFLFLDCCEYDDYDK